MKVNVSVLYEAEISAKLAEIKRIAGVAAGLAPARSKTLNLRSRDLDMIRELLERMKGLIEESLDIAATSNPPISDGPLTALDLEVMSGLLNLGCKRDAAELAVRRARVGVEQDFNTVFRRALDLV